MPFLNRMEKGDVNMLATINEWLWGPISCGLFLAIGVILTVKTRFFQFLHIRQWLLGSIRSLFQKKNNDKQNGFTAIQSLSTALAATLGTGNIVGVATAIVTGGPGAVFWMWMAAVFGMMTKYAEVLLSMHYRKGGVHGSGPMYVLERGLGSKPLAVCYAFFCFIASFGIGNMSQGNSMALAFHSSFHIPPMVTGVMVMGLAGIVLIGGMKRLGAVTEKLIPLMAGFYLFFSILVLILHHEKIPSAFSTIFEEAFRFRSVGGGTLGYTAIRAMRYGVARGIFTNEAGLGTSSMAHSACEQGNAAKQGMMGIFEVFIDTIVVCTITALVILTSGVLGNGESGAALTISAFSMGLGGFAEWFICISIGLFAFASILSWCFYGERCAQYLWGRRAIVVYRWVYILMIGIGCTMSLDAVWQLCDIFNALMAIPNLTGVFVLRKQVWYITKEYLHGS